MGFNKTLELGNLELDIKGETLKEESRKINGHYYCEKCNSRIKRVNYCDNCDSVVGTIRKIVNSEGVEIDDTEYKQNLINPKEIIGFNPISRDDLGLLKIEKLYILSPNTDTEGFNLLFNSLSLNNLGLPIKFRYNANSYEQNGYILVEHGYMVLKLIVEQTIAKDFEKFKSYDVNTEVLKEFKGILDSLEKLDNKESYLEELKLLKEKKQRTKEHKKGLLEQLKAKETIKVKVKTR